MFKDYERSVHDLKPYSSRLYFVWINSLGLFCFAAFLDLIDRYTFNV